MSLNGFSYHRRVLITIVSATLTLLLMPLGLDAVTFDSTAAAQAQSHSHISGFFYNPQDPYHSIFPIRNIEKSSIVDKAGDALISSGDPAQLNLKILSHAMTPDGNCEMCQLIQYTPGPIGKGGIAYRSAQTLDLSGAQRVVFFAKGQLGGENVAFVALGKPSNASSVPPNIFTNMKFAIASKNITLTNQWARYELSLNRTDLTDVVDPFGFIVFKEKNQPQPEPSPSSQSDTNNSPITFFLKGVTFDNKPAVNPIPTVQP